MCQVWVKRGGAYLPLTNYLIFAASSPEFDIMVTMKSVTIDSAKSKGEGFHPDRQEAAKDGRHAATAASAIPLIAHVRGLPSRT